MTLTLSMANKMKERFGITEMEVTDEVFRSKYAHQLIKQKTVCIQSKLSWLQH